MSLSTASLPGIFAVPPGPVRKFTVNEYHRMIQAAILTEEDPVELLEGWIVPKMPRNPLHDCTIQIIHEVLRSHLPGNWQLRIQSAITTTDSEPEPDLVLVPGPITRFRDHHPGPPEIALIIEVADTSLRYDRRKKGRAYAQAGITCYWIVNLIDRQVEVYTNPTGPKARPIFRKHREYDLTDSVPLVINGNQLALIPVRELLPASIG
jgi:Uma2 family endonuclease